MIGIYKQKVNEIPYLVIAKQDKATEPLPTVIYSHGFTSAKEHNLPLAYLLAEKGCRVILPDSMHHGERDAGMSAIEKELSFWNIVMQNVEELQVIKDKLDEDGLILEQKLGLAGTSMGGITTSAALAKYPWIKAAAILMGTPKLTNYADLLVTHVVKAQNLPVPKKEIERLFTQIKDYDLSLHPEKLADRPLMLWHGEQDAVIPFEQSYSFYKNVKKQYKNKNGIKFIPEKNRDHKVSRFAILETVKWFETHLNRPQ